MLQDLSTTCDDGDFCALLRDSYELPWWLKAYITHGNFPSWCMEKREKKSIVYSMGIMASPVIWRLLDDQQKYLSHPWGNKCPSYAIFRAISYKSYSFYECCPERHKNLILEITAFATWWKTFFLISTLRWCRDYYPSLGF